jgi:polygalacturonase
MPKLIFCLLLLATYCQAQVVVYPAPDTLKPSELYQVKINGKALFVYQNQVSSVGYFSFSGKAEVEITCLHDVKWVDVRPKNLGITPIFGGHRITFSIEKPCQLSIELNGEMSRPLYLFAAPLETNVPPPNTPNVQYFEAGKVHEVGTLTLASDETIYIAGGAIVRGTIIANDAQRIKIKGRGILDGTYVTSQMVQLNRCQDIEIEGVIFLNSPGWTIVPRHCQRLNIKDIKQVCWRNGSDGLDLVATSHVRVRDSFFRNNDDNIVLKCWGGDEKYPRTAAVPQGPDMSDIHVSNSVFWNMPWGNALEIGFELRCGKVSDVRFTDCDLIHVERGAAFSIHNGDNATVENILYENIRVEDAMHKLIDLAVFLSQYSLDRPADEAERRQRYMQGAWDGVTTVTPEQKQQYAGQRGHIRNVIFRNIAVTDGQFPYSIISGYDAEHGVDNVRIENLTIHGKRIKNAQEGRFFIENATNILIK